MKPNRTNSFRLQRISRASSLKKHSQTFYHPDDSFKLAAINSVSRGIKYNDATFLVGENLHKLRKEPQEDKDQLYEHSHQGLADVRKKYDDMKKQRVKMDEAIYRLKEDIKKYKIFEKEYLDKIAQAKSRVEATAQDLEEKRQLLEVTAFEKKVLESMRHHLRADKVVFDQRKFNMDKEYSFLQKQMQALRRDGMEISEAGDRTSKIQKAFLRELNEENREREEHLANLEAMIDGKHAMNQHNLERGVEIAEIAERAMQDKNHSEKEWYHIYMTHLFVSKMLRDKIDREMMKFSTVELAFKTIKTATGISDTDTLIFKYLNKEAVYGDLLGRITANEKKIIELKEEQEELVKEQRDLEMEKDTIQNIKLKTTQISHELTELEMVETERLSVETHQKAMAQWLSRQARKFSVIDPARMEEYKFDRSASIQHSFVKYLRQVVNLMGSCEKEESEDVTDAGDLTARDSARVTRIILKKQSKNSFHEDSDEETVPRNANEEEEDMIDMQRGNILANNEKFMKDARRRMEETRKLLVDKDKGKEKEKKVEIKKDDE